MRNLKALAAIIAALFLGAVAATFLAGCQPAKPRVKSLGTTSATTDASPKVEVPQTEIKDEKPADEKESKADDEKAVLPKELLHGLANALRERRYTLRSDRFRRQHQRVPLNVL